MNIDELFPLVRPFVKGCPTPTLTNALRRAARKLCSDSWYALRTVELDVEAGVAAYTIILPGDEEPLGVKAAQFTDYPLNPVQPEAANPVTTGDPVAFFFRPPRQVVLSPVPTEDRADALRLRVPVQPAADAVTIPDAVGTLYDRALADGALAWLLAMPSEQWTSPGEANKREVLFATAVADARRKALRAHMPRSLMVATRRVTVA